MPTKKSPRNPQQKSKSLSNTEKHDDSFNNLKVIALYPTIVFS